MKSDQAPTDNQPPPRLVASLKNPAQWAILDGEWRRGLKDLQDTVLQAFPDSKLTREEAGTIGSPTPQLVTEALKGRSVDSVSDQLKAPEEKRSVLGYPLEQVQSEQQQSRSRGM